MSPEQLGRFFAYAPGTVLRDGSGCVWGKKWHLWQRFGSLGDYDPEAIVLPVDVLYAPDSVTVEAGGGDNGSVADRLDHRDSGAVRPVPDPAHLRRILAS